MHDRQHRKKTPPGGAANSTPAATAQMRRQQARFSLDSIVPQKRAPCNTPLADILQAYYDARDAHDCARADVLAARYRRLLSLEIDKTVATEEVCAELGSLAGTEARRAHMRRHDLERIGEYVGVIDG